MGITTTRTVRFTPEELRDIESFIKKNSFLDFSTLTRLAIAEYIRHPTLQISPIDPKRIKTKNARSGDSHV